MKDLESNMFLSIEKDGQDQPLEVLNDSLEHLIIPIYPAIDVNLFVSLGQIEGLSCHWSKRLYKNLGRLTFKTIELDAIQPPTINIDEVRAEIRRFEKGENRLRFLGQKTWDYVARLNNANATDPNNIIIRWVDGLHLYFRQNLNSSSNKRATAIDRLDQMYKEQNIFDLN